MNVKGVILDKQSLGPYAATSWQIGLLHQQPREIVLRVSHILFIALSVSVHMDQAYFVISFKKITRLHDCDGCKYVYTSVCDNTAFSDLDTKDLVHDAMNMWLL